MEARHNASLENRFNSITNRIRDRAKNASATEERSPTPPEPSPSEQAARAERRASPKASCAPAPVRERAKAAPEGQRPATRRLSAALQATEKVQQVLMERIDLEKASQLSREELQDQMNDLVHEIMMEMKIQFNSSEHREVVERLLDEMVGLGPLEPLLADDSIADIMVNGANCVYIERGGKLERTEVTFRNDAHVLNIAQRIVQNVGRRIDESNPLVDARLNDGSRVNMIIPPLALDGPSISIRKFTRQKVNLDQMARNGNLSAEMATTLKVAARCRLNILICGGTGSGKTTMLNAMSEMIPPSERIVTIEDAAELQLQQPHVVRLETRPANMEGEGEITMRTLLKNSLRMRPDRVILGEVRGAEAIDMLQAMNTGHDGSLGTIHANGPREATKRLENLVAMAGLGLPSQAIREEIASAIDLLVQVERMRDGTRRITSISEIVGMEGEVFRIQELYRFDQTGEDRNGKLLGNFVYSGIVPSFMDRARKYNLDAALQECA